MPYPIPPLAPCSAADRSRQLIRDSRARIASAQARLRHTRQALARQRYLQIVCAWCQQTIRWERAAQATWGQISHSICYDCFAWIFQELDAPPPRPVRPPQVP